MKKITSFFLVAFVGCFVAFQSCNNLDLQPLDRVTTETYYKTPADFDGAMFAAYSSMQDLYGTSTETLGENGEFWKLTLVITDDVDSDRDKTWDAWSDPIDDLLLRASDAPYQSVYAGIYEGILRCNLVIEAAASTSNSLSAADKAKYTGEAKFMRAFYHFLAMQMWGTPPLVLEVKKDINNLSTPNATQAQLFEAILADLRDAAAGLPDNAGWGGSNLGRATKWAAKAMEGKVNVWKKDWPAAIAAFEAVEASGQYGLEANYEDAFSFSNENGKESLFEIQYGGPFSDDNLWVFDDTHSEAFKASQGVGRSWYWDAAAPPVSNGKLGFWVPSKNLVAEYEAGDPRLKANIYSDGDTYYSNGGGQATYVYDKAWSSTGHTLRKYRGEKNNQPGNYSGNGQADYCNERWMRYAEVLLLHAEALIESGNPSAGMDIINNQIRQRVGLGVSPIADPVKALRHERRVEMAFEPHRWFDITRWGIGAEVFGSKWDNKFNVMPFPQSAIDRSGGIVKQNPGY